MSHQTTIQLIEDCLASIANGNTDTALTMLMNFEGGKYRSKFISFANRLNRLTKERNQGTVNESAYEARLNRLNAGLIKTLDAWKNNAGGVPGGGMGKWIGYGVIGLVVFGVAIWWVMQPKVDCGPEGKVQVHVADFDETADAFSPLLQGEIINKIGETDYFISSTNYLNAKDKDQINKYRSKAFENCNRSGLMVYGDLVLKDGLDPVLACFIQLTNMAFQVPKLVTDQEVYFIKNPPDLEFKIGTNAELIAEFIQAILNVYAAKDIAELDNALSLLNKVQTSELAMADEDVKATAIFYQGVVQTMKGNVEAAKTAFQEIQAMPKFKPVVIDNLRYVKEVEVKRIENPGFVPLLVEQTQIEVRETSPDDLAMAAFEKVDQKDTSQIKTFLTKYPDYNKAEELKTILNNLRGEAAYADLDQSDTEAVLAFLQQFPNHPEAPALIKKVAKSKEEADFLALDLKDTTQLLNFLDLYPNYKEGKALQDTLYQLRASAIWSALKETDNITSIENFIKRFPKSKHLNKAKERIINLKWSAIKKAPTEETVKHFYRIILITPMQKKPKRC